jgi:hypothetical protein
MAHSGILLPIRVDDKWGYINVRGEVVVPCQYDYASEFSEGLALTRRGFNYESFEESGLQEYVVIDEQLREVGAIACSYWHEFSEGLLAFELNDKWGYVDASLEIVIPPSFHNAGSFVDGLAWVSVRESRSGGVVDRDGIIDRQGKWVIPPIYDSVSAFKRSEKVAAFKAGIPRTWPERLRVLYSKRAVEAILIDYNNDRAEGHSVEEAEITSGLAMVKSATDDPTAELSLDDLFRYAQGEPRSEMRAWGLIDRKGNVVVEPRFQSIGWPSKGMLAAGMRVGDEQRHGIINERGEWLVEPRWEDADGGFTDDLMSASIDGKWGLVNRQGEWVIEPQYTNAERFSDGLCSVYVGGGRDLDYCLVGGKYGFINKAGEMIIEPRFDGVCDFENGVCEVELIEGDPEDNRSLYGYIDSQGHYIWEPTC